MSLTLQDLDEIRSIVNTGLSRQINDIITPLQSDLEAIKNDIKDIYFMSAELQHSTITDKEFEK